MNYYKIVLVIFSIYLCHFISEAKYFQVPDNYWEAKKCKAIENGYEHNNIVIEKEGIQQGDAPIDCWHTCNYGEKCMIKLEQPTTYSFLVRIISGIILSITYYIVFEI